MEQVVESEYHIHNFAKLTILVAVYFHTLKDGKNQYDNLKVFIESLGDDVQSGI